ncbi:MAG: 7,8-didemethyl-8-hydroxy-5-deazariboflavin synthase CofG, partial [Alphaproteobacteria bacterium]
MTRDQILKFATAPNPQELFLKAKALRDIGHGHDISFSRKVFIPLTKLCRNVCSYCTFAHPPRRGEFPFLTPDEVLKIANAGKALGCKEALFTLGDKPELRYEAARDALAKLGHATTISYLTEMCDLVFTETGLLPHSNPGVVSGEEMRGLREFTVSQGLMLENISSRLTKKGQPHFGSPDKDPDLRLETIREAGRQSIPFTTGILIGIGETWAERIDSLLEIKKTNDEFKHIQEIIIQNFRSKPLTKMENAREPSLEELMRCIAIARIILGPKINIQAPPNLTPDTFQMLIEAGINDWGGISPVTPDHVNPEAPCPEILNLSARTAEAGKMLVERL